MCIRWTLFSFLYQPVIHAAERLAYRMSSHCNPNHHPNYAMSTKTKEEVIAIMDGAGVFITELKATSETLKAAVKAAEDALAPLVAENTDLKTLKDALEAADAEIDAAAEKLADVVSPPVVVDPPVDEPPVEEPPVEEPPVEDPVVPTE